MKGFIYVNAYSKNEEYLYQARRMKEEFAKKNVAVDIIEGDKFLLYIEGGNIVSKATEYDFCVFWDKDKYALAMLDKIGMPMFNSCKSILTCDDKMLTYIELANNGVPIPKTYAGLLCYQKNEVVKPETMDLIEELSYPMVVKNSYGSLGNGVFLARNREELAEIMEEVKCKSYLIQEYIKTSYGKDVRIIVIGDKIVGAMLRKSNNDFRSNIGSGGSGEVFELTDEMKALALKTAKILGLDYCGIDVLFGENGPVICEVNSNAYFFTFERVTGINVAEHYVDFILQKMSQQ